MEDKVKVSKNWIEINTLIKNITSTEKGMKERRARTYCSQRIFVTRMK